MAEVGPKIPQGLVLFVQGPEQSSVSGSYRRRRGATQNNERHGALVSLPSSYKAALEVAFRQFGKSLGVTDAEDLVLKRVVTTSHTFGCLVYAEFDQDDWDRVMVGPELEIGVFKVNKAESAPQLEPFYDDYNPPLSPIPAPAPFTNPLNNPWLNKNFAMTPISYNPAPVDNKDKTVQLTRVISTKGDALANGEGLQTAIVGLPETYDECERVAREVFDPPQGSKMTMKVAAMPSGIYNYTDYTKSSNWTSVHKSAYTTSILTYNGAFEILVDFIGGVEDGVKSAPGEGSSDAFLML